MWNFDSKSNHMLIFLFSYDFIWLGTKDTASVPDSKLVQEFRSLWPMEMRNDGRKCIYRIDISFLLCLPIFLRLYCSSYKSELEYLDNFALGVESHLKLKILIELYLYICIGTGTLLYCSDTYSMQTVLPCHLGT